MPNYPLPFLQEKKQDTFSVGGSVTMDQVDPGLIAAAYDLLKALESKDTKALAMALKNAFELCDAQPHKEGEHIP